MGDAPLRWDREVTARWRWRGVLVDGRPRRVKMLELHHDDGRVSWLVPVTEVELGAGG